MKFYLLGKKKSLKYSKWIGGMSKLTKFGYVFAELTNLQIYITIHPFWKDPTIKMKMDLPLKTDSIQFSPTYKKGLVAWD